MTPAQQRLLVACGARAGMAAAYNVPFGGALFALEVLLGTLSISLVLPALAASLIATAVSWFFLSDQSTYTIPAFSAPTSLMVWALAVGPLLGLASVGYIRAIAWADEIKPRRWFAVAAPVSTRVLTDDSAFAKAGISHPHVESHHRARQELWSGSQIY